MDYINLTKLFKHFILPLLIILKLFHVIKDFDFQIKIFIEYLNLIFTHFIIQNFLIFITFFSKHYNSKNYIFKQIKTNYNYWLLSTYLLPLQLVIDPQTLEAATHQTPSQ